MAQKIGINGFGRIGRLAFRVINQHYRDKLDVAVQKALAHPTTKAILYKSDVMVYYQGHMEFSKYISEHKENLGKLMKDLGIIK